ncbi:MAG: CARDB domain-containing protein [Candidatus Micrarchaeota archaeon]
MKIYLYVFLYLLVCIVSADIQVSHTLLPDNFKPGTKGSVQIVLLNTGVSEITNIILVPRGHGITVEQYNAIIGDLKGNSSTIITVPFKVNENVNSGIYTLEIIFYWTEETKYSRILSIPILVTNFPEFTLLNISEITASRGKDFYFNVTIANNGGKAFDVLLTPDSPNFFSKNTTKISLGDIRQNQNVSLILTFTSSTSLLSNLYSLPLVLTYYDEIGNNLKSTLLIPVRIISIEPKLITSTKADITEPGEEFEVLIKIRNSGLSEANNINIFLNPTYPFTLLTSKTIHIQKLGIGEEINMSAKFISTENVALSPYTIPILVTYKDKNEVEYATNESIGVRVQGNAKLDIAKKTTIPQTISEDERFTLNVKLENTGTDDAKAVRVILEGLEGDTVAYVGKIKRDDYETAIFSLESGSAGKKTLKLLIEYEDNGKEGDGKRKKSIEKEISLIVYKKPFLDVTLLIILGVAILSVFALTRFWGRRA